MCGGCWTSGAAGSRGVREDMADTRLKVLVIDDEARIRLLIRQTLQGEYEILEAADGTVGLQQAQAGKPHLILLDLRMPGLDGLSVLRRLKADPATAGIPVVIVSAHGETDHLLEGQQAGAVDFLIKPFEVEGLRRMVHRQLTLED